MKRAIACLFLLATPAMAQQAPRQQGPDPAALSQELLECVSGKVNLRSQATAIEQALNARIGQLQGEFDKAKAPAASQTDPGASATTAPVAPVASPPAAGASRTHVQ